MQGLDNLNQKAKSGINNGIGNKLLGNNNNNKNVTKPKVNVDLKRKRFSTKQKSLDINVQPSHKNNTVGGSARETPTLAATPTATANNKK